MLKLEIQLDERKVLEDKKYEFKSIYDAIDKAFGKYDFSKEVRPDGTMIYYGNGQAGDYGAFGRIITTLKGKAWFMDYAKKWLWYNSDDSDDENDFAVEDVLYHYTKRESAA